MPMSETSGVLAKSPAETAWGGDPNWWRQAVVYQIYPRSFADSDGDGLGDLPGVTSRVPYLQELGVDAVWLSPFYPSALADGGYDVDDYRAVDPRLGTLADFDEMLSALHNAGIRVVVDIVPNHSSNRHKWFLEALAAAPGSPERERYIFRDGKGANGELPPSDWVSTFGGPAWTRVPDGQWYLHTFAKEQPDWNWDNREVQLDFLETLKFWADRGVDGFRIDVASNLKKDLSLYPDLPTQEQLWDETLWQPGRFPFADRDEVFDVYREWRELFNQYNPPRTAVAEAWVKPERQHLYAAPDGLGQVFNFDLLKSNFDSGEFREVIDRNLLHAAQTGSSNTWVLSNHDVVRHATRYGLPFDETKDNQIARKWDLADGLTIPLDAEQGIRRARAATLLLFALPGSTYIYQGEELGLPSITGIAAEDRQDPTYFRNAGVDVGRDGCRIPIPWVSNAPSFGFGTTSASHLPQPREWGNLAVDVESTDPSSTLSLYRNALALRHKLQTGEALEWLDAEAPNKNVLIFARPSVVGSVEPSRGANETTGAAGGKRWVCATNFGKTPVPMPAGEVILTSSPLTGPAELPAETTAWLLR